jgi:long-chain fatty acid transport protein
MGGANTAAPLSAAGALFWNAATLSGLDRSQLEVAAEALYVDSRLGSTFGAGTLAPGIPPVGFGDSTRSDSGVFALPTFALAYSPECSRFTFGLGVFPVAGFGVDYAGSLTNPVLTPPPPRGIGFGPVYSDYQVMQIAPAVSYRVTDRLSVGLGPTVDVAMLKLNPALFAPPDDGNGDGFFTFPNGTHGETTWGTGFTAGVYFTGDSWAVGASYRSPQWFDTFRFNSANEVGLPRRLTVDVDLPSIISVGAAYTGLERWVFALDARYLDYASTNGFGENGFTALGSLKGLNFRSIFVVAAGVQFQLSDALALRAGYTWNETPIREADTAINLASPTILQSMASLGAAWNVTHDLTLSLFYLHAFENTIEGSMQTPFGPVPGTSVKSRVSADSIGLSATVKFGPVLRHTTD